MSYQSAILDVQLTVGMGAIWDVAIDMSKMAHRLDLTVKCSFNDCTLIAKPETMPSEIVHQYDEYLDSLKKKG